MAHSSKFLKTIWWSQFFFWQLRILFFPNLYFLQKEAKSCVSKVALCFEHNFLTLGGFFLGEAVGGLKNYFLNMWVSTVGALIRGKGQGFWRNQKVKKIINHSHEVKIRKIFEEAFLYFFLYEILPTSFWVLIHPLEVKIRCNCEEALRKSSSTSENQVKFLRRHKKFYIAK